MADHPTCGIYRTTQPLEGIPAGRLVYFHNHGEPGPGVYLPELWNHNRAQWQARGTTILNASWSASLAPIAAEGLYRVKEQFVCCSNRCRTYEPGLLVQLGYDGDARPLLFVPEWTNAGLSFPEQGLKFEEVNQQKLEAIAVTQARTSAPEAANSGGLLH